jgi:phage host-nuclease inhibitor protein Gam
LTTYTPDTAEDAQEAREAFHIDSDQAAEWLLRRLANIAAEQARVQVQAAAIVAQLETDANRLRHLFEGELQEYCRQKLAAQGSRRRSCTFLQGTVSFRTVPPSVKVADPAAALIYARTAAPALVRSVVTLDTAGYRDQAAKHLRETGELLPGVDTTPEHETVRISFGKPE